MGKILCVGSVMVDVLAKVPALPRSGEGVLVDEVDFKLGGCALNSANVLRQLGAPFRLFAPMGTGIYSTFVRNELHALGMTAFEVEDATIDNGAAICFVEPSGQRTMVTMPGIEARFQKAWFDQVDPSAFTSGFVCGYEVDSLGGDAIISFFEQHPNIQLVYAPGPMILDVSAETTARINALNPIWHLNDQELVAYATRTNMSYAADILAEEQDVLALIGDCANTVLSECGNTVVVTAGASGSFALWDGGYAYAPTTPVRVVDTVGAGDSHLGALLAAREHGYSWEKSLELANTVATAVCQVQGAALPDSDFPVAPFRQ